jgi:hypothetical protein
MALTDTVQVHKSVEQFDLLSDSEQKVKQETDLYGLLNYDAVWSCR